MADFRRIMETSCGVGRWTREHLQSALGYPDCVSSDNPDNMSDRLIGQGMGGGDEYDPFDGHEEYLEENAPNVGLAAPHESKWYHGRLDRFQSEQRLRTAARPGSYLIRASDRRTGSYVLSYLGSSGIHHFRITSVCGAFYIGGRQFDSLADLIGYYSLSDLLKNEKLQYPVSPPEPVVHLRRVVAILPYTKMADTDELSFQKNDVFVVQNDMGDGWLWATHHKTGESGLVFQELVEDLEEGIDPNEIYPWFHSALLKADAVDLLIKSGPGSFLVRPSDNSPGDYSLFFHINSTIQRFRVERKGNRYFMGGRCFDTLEAVINRYKTEQIVEGHTLLMPVVKQSRFSAVPKKIGKDHVDGCAWSSDSQSASSFVSQRANQKKSEDIYATLEQSRETGFLARKNKGIRMKGYLQKKSQHNKKWKTMYFILQVTVTDQHLLFYDNPKRTKPKGLVDLSYSALYMVHDSLFERPFCFQLVERALPCISTVYYLSANTQAAAQEWMSALGPLCGHQSSFSTGAVIGAGGPGAKRVKEVRSLHLNVTEAHRLPAKSVQMTYCVVCLDQVKVCRTKVRSAPDPFWDEDFFLDDIPLDVMFLTITLMSKGKRTKDTECAVVSVEINTLTNGEESDEWYHLNGVSLPLRDDWGSMRVRSRYVHEVIMPTEEYQPLQELILDRHLEAVCGLADICNQDRIPLAITLLRIFRADGREAELLQAMNDTEIIREEETPTLFRAASLTTALMDQYMRATCEQFLRIAIFDTVRKVMDSKQSCELNPSKLEHPSENTINAENLLRLLDDLIESVFMAVDACPKSLRHVFYCLQKTVTSRWRQEPQVRTRVVSGFIFLRLLCPAILNPRQFNLIEDPPSEMASRSLVLIAKCMQNLANLVEFGGKEPYMEVVNPFIIKNKERMVLFLDHLSNVRERPEPELLYSGDISRDLACLHQICVSHLSELNVLTRIKPGIKKLVMVVEMLLKHKDKYVESLR